MFSNLKKSTNTTITLPDGRTVSVAASGIVCLASSFTLSNVLYIPSFSFNLLSVSTLILQIKCSVTFLTDSCIIQDLARDLMIGRGNCHDNLYFLETTFHVCSLAISSSFLSKLDIWHTNLAILMS